MIHKGDLIKGHWQDKEVFWIVLEIFDFSLRVFCLTTVKTGRLNRLASYEVVQSLDD